MFESKAEFIGVCVVLSRAYDMQYADGAESVPSHTSLSYHRHNTSHKHRINIALIYKAY